MIDDKFLNDLMTSAAEQQDDLLPTAVEDDTTRGRRRLRRTRLLAGAGSVTAAAAVTAVVVAGTAVFGTSSAHTDNAPAATTTAAVSPPTPSRAPKVAVTVSGGVTMLTGPRRPPPPVPSTGDLGPAIRAALVRHLDPDREHLVLDDDAVPASGQAGVRIATGQAGWKIGGQRGEGVIYLEVADSQRAIGTPCPNGRLYPIAVTCHNVAIGNGETVQVGRRGDEWEAAYVRPDGTVVHVAVRSRFAQNTEVAVHDLGITQNQLVELVQDDGLRMPELSAAEREQRDRLARFHPSTKDMSAALARVLTGGRLTTPTSYLIAEQAEATVTYRPAGTSATQRVSISVDVEPMVSDCLQQVMIECLERVTLPNGRTGWFGQDARAGLMGVRYRQPDGDMAFAGVWGTAANGVTRDQLFHLVVDPALDDR